MVLPGQGKNSIPEKKQIDNWKVKNAVIHTMQKDLEDPSSSSDKSVSFESPNENKSPFAPAPKNVPESAPQASPFLTATPTQKSPLAPESKPLFARRAQIKSLPVLSPIQEKPVEELHQQGQKVGRSIMIATVISIILIAGLGAYYFITTRQSAPDSTPAAVVDSSGEASSENSPKNNSEFSLEKANYLTIDPTKTDKTKIKEMLSQYADKVASANISSAVEFSVVDPQKSPVDFSTFAGKLNLTLSKPLSVQLEKSFSLFIYNDNGKKRVGLAIDIKDESAVKKAMLQEEKLLAKEIEGLFLASQYKINSSKYFDSQYKDIAIRYSNITSPEDLSVDYAVSGKKLLIGTTKMTLRSILDYYEQASR